MNPKLLNAVNRCKMKLNSNVQKLQCPVTMPQGRWVSVTKYNVVLLFPKVMLLEPQRRDRVAPSTNATVCPLIVFTIITRRRMRIIIMIIIIIIIMIIMIGIMRK